MIGPRLIKPQSSGRSSHKSKISNLFRNFEIITLSTSNLLTEKTLYSNFNLWDFNQGLSTPGVPFKGSSNYRECMCMLSWLIHFREFVETVDCYKKTACRRGGSNLIRCPISFNIAHVVFIHIVADCHVCPYLVQSRKLSDRRVVVPIAIDKAVTLHDLPQFSDNHDGSNALIFLTLWPGRCIIEPELVKSYTADNINSR